MRINTRFKKFLSYYKPFKWLLIKDLICAAIASVSVLVYPILVRTITQEAISDAGINSNKLIAIAAAFIVLMVVEYFSNYYIAYKGHVMGAKMEFNMRNDLFSHFQKLSFKYYDNQKTGQLMSRITNDLNDVTELSHHGPEEVIISGIKIIGAFIILLNVNWILTLLIFAVLPFMTYFSVHYNKQMKATFKKNREKIAIINAQIEDSLSGIRVVKSFANEDIEFNKFNEGNHNFVLSKANSFKFMGRFHSGLSAFISFINIFVVVVGAILIDRHVFGVSELLMFMLYINMLIEPIRRFMNFTEQFQNGATGFERFQEIMEIDPDIADSPNAVEIKNVKGGIEFKNVTFTYGEDSGNVLENLNLKADPGDYIALVGPSGAGKTTLCSLIPRFYETSSGQILLDGQDIKSVTLSSLRRSIGIVQQDVYLFTGTISDNIRYGKPDCTDAEIVEAAKNANAHDFIMSLPDGYDTYVGQRGVKLSGGQKQRISIARVFLKNPAILILDEATSALDNESEKIVHDSFDKLSKNRTTFVIAHRLSTIRNAKRILVLTEDGIIEDGSHQQLLEKNGIYAGLYNMQFSESV